MPPKGFEGFNRPTKTKPYVKTPEDIAVGEFRDKFGLAQTYSSSEIFHDKVLSLIPKNYLMSSKDRKNYFVFVGASNSSEAQKIGLRLQKGLIGKRNVPSHILYFHDSTLWVGYDGGMVSLSPLVTVKKERTSPIINKLKKELITKATDSFGGKASVNGSVEKGKWNLSIKPPSGLAKLVGTPTFYFSSFEEAHKKLDEAIEKFDSYVESGKIPAKYKRASFLFRNVTPYAMKFPEVRGWSLNTLNSPEYVLYTPCRVSSRGCVEYCTNSMTATASFSKF